MPLPSILASSIIPVSQTPGTGYSWSGCAGRVLRGIEILRLLAIDADIRMSFHLEATQTPPTSCLNDNCLTLVNWYAGAIKKHIEHLLVSQDLSICIIRNIKFKCY